MRNKAVNLINGWRKPVSGNTTSKFYLVGTKVVIKIYLGNNVVNLRSKPVIEVACLFSGLFFKPPGIRQGVVEKTCVTNGCITEKL